MPLRARLSLARCHDACTHSMTKIECENCGRKVTVDGDEHVVQKKFCPRCGTEFPDHE